MLHSNKITFSIMESVITVINAVSVNTTITNVSISKNQQQKTITVSVISTKIR